MNQQSTFSLVLAMSILDGVVCVVPIWLGVVTDPVPFLLAYLIIRMNAHAQRYPK